MMPMTLARERDVRLRFPFRSHSDGRGESQGGLSVCGYHRPVETRSARHAAGR